MAIQKALETLFYVNGFGSVAIETAQIHFETGGSVARQLLDAPSLYPWCSRDFGRHGNRTDDRFFTY